VSVENANEYNLGVMPFSRRALLIASAVLVAAFVALYPVLDCGEGGCPDALHTAGGTAMSACLAVLLAALPAALARPDGPVRHPWMERAMSSQADRPPEPYPPKPFL
jgi:hypothetical protein